MATSSAFVAPALNAHRWIDETQSGYAATSSRQFHRQRIGINFRNDHASGRLRNTRVYNKLKDFFNPYESKIPDELREEIYKAEANTEAARDREKRVAIYLAICIVAVGCGGLNVFLTELRNKETAEAAATIPDAVNSLYILEKIGFGWVLSNPVFKFLFTNMIGGGLAILVGGGAGLLAEAEFDTKRINAEKIYEEMERRRDQKQRNQKRSGSQKQNKKKRRSGKEKKRLTALSEVVMDDIPSTTVETTSKDSPSVSMSEMPTKEITSIESSGNDSISATEEGGGNDKNGIFGKMKDLYEKADSMAASQALILNKNLEEAGVVEKITDETGLKVIGREEAKKLEDKRSSDEKE